MESYNFRLIAVNETYGWSSLPVGCSAVYGIYLVCDGERTHACSFSASSWATFIENHFSGIDGEHEFVEEHAYNNGGESGAYFNFIDFSTTAIPHSESFTVEADSRSEAWAEAQDDVNANPPYIAIPE